MKKSLSRKLFCTIAVSFIVLIVCIILSLFIYFNSFYEKNKINNIVSSINEFATRYSKNDWSEDELFREIGIFSSKNNTSLVVKRNESEHPEGESKVVLITSVDENNENYYDFFISAEVFYSLGLSVGSSVQIEGYLKENGVVTPLLINGIRIDESEGESSSGEHSVEEGGEESEGNAEARNQQPESTNFDKTVIITSIKENLTLPSVDEERSNVSYLYSDVKNEVYYTVSEMPHTGIKQVDFQKNIMSKSGVEAKLYVNSSLQSIDETLQFITSFFPYFFVFSLLLALVISYFYSKSVSKPIINITNVADDMANMDFDKRLDEAREDELGKLAGSLNILSTNLHCALTELTLANEKLQEDYDKELKQKQAQKEFIANASHELKTPLGIIRSYAEGIKDDVQNENKDEYIDVITDEIHKMDSLIREMMQIFKYDSMDMSISKESTDLLLLISDAVQSFEKILKDRELLIDINGYFGECMVDSEKISTAILNLIGNAVKYSDAGTTITIKGTQVGDKTRVDIINACKPFTDDDLEKVWERFYRRDTSHSREVEGTGLGLAIVKSIFDAHEVSYGVENAGDGVDFWFEV